MIGNIAKEIENKISNTSASIVFLQLQCGVQPRSPHFRKDLIETEEAESKLRDPWSSCHAEDATGGSLESRLLGGCDRLPKSQLCGERGWREVTDEALHQHTASKASLWSELQFTWLQGLTSAQGRETERQVRSIIPISHWKYREQCPVLGAGCSCSSLSIKLQLLSSGLTPAVRL